jgi:aspartyl-tRNA(Asn)/glutamyl-tRNA(Gln) amidotransferase subunit C
MSVDKTTVEQIAHLARLEFKEEALETMINDMNRMLAFVDKLNELPTEGVEPLIYMVDEVNVLREDVVKQEITREEGLKNAPKHDSDYFRVPKVIEQK